MQRHSSLRELSRDHHHGLVQARHLRRATVRSAARCVDDFLHFWNSELSRHFREEEELLLPIACRRLPADDPQFTRMLAEHTQARGLIRALMAADDDADRLCQLSHELGKLLETHIRFEERELFPRLEAELTPEILAAVDSALSQPTSYARRASCAVRR